MTDRYALFGLPLGRTKSPLIHTEFARQMGQDLTYEAIEAPAVQCHWHGADSSGAGEWLSLQ
jgi:shikimate dehydrogenase